MRHAIVAALVMFRKVTIALLATAALGMLAPDVASARGGGGGGFHGGGGGFHGGFGSSGFYGGVGFGRGGIHAARFFGGRSRGAAIGGREFRAGFRRIPGRHDRQNRPLGDAHDRAEAAGGAVYHVRLCLIV